MSKVTLINPLRKWHPDLETLENVLSAASRIARGQMSDYERGQLNIRLRTYKDLSDVAKAVLELDHWVGCHDGAIGDAAPVYEIANVRQESPNEDG